LKSIRGSLLGKEGASSLNDKASIGDGRPEGLFEIKKEFK
jgi:hypothetical protein